LAAKFKDIGRPCALSLRRINRVFEVPQLSAGRNQDAG
jgi:hypothetical protein